MGFDALEARVMLTASESDFSFDAPTGFITGCTGPGSAVIIPASIGGQAVVGIGDYAFTNATSLTSVTFKGNASLSSVTFTGRAPTVGSSAFSGLAFGATAFRQAGLPGYGRDGARFHRLTVARPRP